MICVARPRQRPPTDRAFAPPPYYSRPYYWFCKERHWLRQSAHFDKWQLRNCLAREVSEAIDEWLHLDLPEIDRAITNLATGAQYRVSGQKGPPGVLCKVEFVGNLNCK